MWRFPCRHLRIAYSRPILRKMFTPGRTILKLYQVPGTTQVLMLFTDLDGKRCACFHAYTDTAGLWLWVTPSEVRQVDTYFPSLPKTAYAQRRRVLRWFRLEAPTDDRG